MRIIDDGPHESVVKTIVCMKCGCTLEYAPIDVQISGFDYFIECQNCKFIITVPKPDYVKMRDSFNNYSGDNK